MFFVLFLLLAFIPVQAQDIKYEDYFNDLTLRIDYQHSGDKKTDMIFLQEFIQEGKWAGPRKRMVEEYELGKYKFCVYDSASGKLIYTKSFATLFSEWQTTDEANEKPKSFEEAVRMPFPKKTIRAEFLSRDKRNVLHKKYEFYLNPNSEIFIRKEAKHKADFFPVVNSGDPANCVDIVIIPEGYTEAEMALFKADCEKFAGYLFKAQPYKDNKSKFNVWGVKAVSEESGTDLPGKNIWKKTALGSTFYTFYSERYLMTTQYHTVCDYAANAPYDIIYILVNTNKYGGGAIFNHYNVCVNNNIYEEYIFTHEFGHGFASLADEYVEIGSSYNDFYALDVEPLDPNLTTLVDFKSKWADLVSPGVKVPTEESTENMTKVGAFEGGGYVPKGIYRPMMDCSMKSISVDKFCPVCKRGIVNMIKHYTE